MDQERRRSRRFPFIASAEVLSESAGARLAARISDLTETQVFEAPATVVYSHTHLGRGLIFIEVLGNSRNVLQNWLPVAS